MATLHDGNLVLDEGETVRFPVESDHPLIECQQMRRIHSLDDLRDFHFVQEWAQGFDLTQPPRQPRPDRPAPTGSELGSRPPLRTLISGNRQGRDEFWRDIVDRFGGIVLSLQLSDLIIPTGSSVVLTEPLAEINAATVVIAGQLKFTNDLVIRCNEIRGV